MIHGTEEIHTKIIHYLQNLMVCFLLLIFKSHRTFRITFRVLDPELGHRISGITNYSGPDREFPNYRCSDKVFLNVSDFFNRYEPLFSCGVTFFKQ